MFIKKKNVVNQFSKVKIFLMIGLSVLFFVSNICFGQSVTLSVKEVTFTNSHQMRWASTLEDVKTPQWESSYSEQEPIAFSMNNNICASFKMNLSSPWSDGSGVITFWGMGSDSVSFGPINITVMNGFTEVECELVTSINRAGCLTSDKIGGKNYEITWLYSFDYGNTFYDAGTTVNPCYITLSSPQAPWSNHKCYVEIMHIACMRHMLDKTNEISALDKLIDSAYSYMTYNGGTHYTSSNYNHQIRDFILNSSPTSGPGSGNDCRDFVCHLDVTAAAVGISPEKVYLHKLQDNLTPPYGSDSDKTFTTNTVTPANGSATTYTFDYHTFVSDYSDPTYPYGGCQSADASLKIGSDMVDYDRSITTYIFDLTNDPDARILFGTTNNCLSCILVGNL